jgi:hypothetical protein
VAAIRHPPVPRSLERPTSATETTAIGLVADINLAERRAGQLSIPSRRLSAHANAIHHCAAVRMMIVRTMGVNMTPGRAPRHARATTGCCRPPNNRFCLICGYREAVSRSTSSKAGP